MEDTNYEAKRNLDEVCDKSNALFAIAMDHFQKKENKKLKRNIEELEKILKLMKEYKVESLTMDELHLKLFDDFDGNLSPETQAQLNKMKQAEQVSDEEVLFNPYAGLEGLEENE